MEKYLVVRTSNTVEVAIMPRIEDGKYSFVNLTEGHICKCKFDTLDGAIADLEKQILLGRVISYTKASLTGLKVRNKNSGKMGVVLRVTESGSVQVLEKIEPYVICTHDNWNTLEIIE